MHRVVGLTLILVGLGWWLCYLDAPGTDLLTRVPPVDWVRTVDGWERGAALGTPSSIPPQLHPLVVAAAQLLASLYALVAWDPE